MFTLTKRTYVTADRSRVVGENSPDAAFLLGGEGAVIDDDTANHLGLNGKKAEPEPVRKPVR